jgi:hypothetical protein
MTSQANGTTKKPRSRAKVWAIPAAMVLTAVIGGATALIQTAMQRTPAAADPQVSTPAATASPSASPSPATSRTANAVPSHRASVPASPSPSIPAKIRIPVDYQPVGMCITVSGTAPNLPGRYYWLMAKTSDGKIWLIGSVPPGRNGSWKQENVSIGNAQSNGASVLQLYGVGESVNASLTAYAQQPHKDPFLSMPDGADLLDSVPVVRHPDSTTC